MNANELMIGDWVYSSFYYKSTKPCRITGIRTFDIKDVYAFVYVDKVEDIKDINSLTPIPLTPEILEKNGFEDIGDDTYQLEEKPYCFWVDFFNHQYGCEYDTSTHEYEDDEHRLKLYGIPSVHELQHALRLCGIEKDIIL